MAKAKKNIKAKKSIIKAGNAFVKLVAGNSVDDGMHQTNPSWLVTFVRWSNRSPKDVKGIDPLKSEAPLVVDTDCTAITTTDSKISPTPGVSITLKMGKYNYLTAIAPGDYMFVNILNSEAQAKVVSDRVSAQKSVNLPEHGFKGMYKVQSVRKTISIDPQSGTRVMACTVQGHAFTELNNTIYFNAQLATGEVKNDFLFLTTISDKWRQLITKKAFPSVQYLVAVIYSMFVGVGAPDRKTQLRHGLFQNYNEHFFVPTMVGTLLGVETKSTVGIAVQDIYDLLFGKQQYSAGSSTAPQDGLNPINLTDNGLMPRLRTTNLECEGNSYVQAEYWQNVTAFSLMQQYLNSPINELYTTFKLNPNGNIMPTLIMRQIPFASQTYSDQTATKFLNLPRWKIDPNYIYSMNIGREEAARFNFVQGFGRVQMSANPDAEISRQIAEGNYVYDKQDIKKNGLRPKVFTSNFDIITNVSVALKRTYKSQQWTRLIADAVIGGHLKLNGSVVVPGMVDPISVGDNLEIGDVVYHIETISHQCNQSPNGDKKFTTSMELSNGVLDSKVEKYAEMKNSNLENHQLNDFYGGGFEPAISSDSFGAFNSTEVSFDPETRNALTKAEKERGET